MEFASLAHRTSLTFLLLLTFRPLAGHAQVQPTQPTQFVRPQPTQMVSPVGLVKFDVTPEMRAATEEYIGEQLTNPNSARFTDLAAYRDQDGSLGLVCGLVSAKPSVGDLSRSEPFIVISIVKTGAVQSDISDGDDNAFYQRNPACRPAPSPVASSSVAEGQTEVFGVALGAPLSLPTCPKPAFTIDSAGNVMNVSHPECFDGDFVQFATGQAPSWVRFFTITVDDGVVDDIEISNRDGIAAQDQIYNELTEKFGRPTSKSVVREQNGFGATFDVIYAVWNRADGVISFLGDGDISVKSNAFLTHEKQKEGARAHL